ncbi:lanthionine synthetase LanC family protein [Dyadobacter sp. CY261]|uniref:lanthionine synthetase LanC family protein n=1 Tax=Dyadobacter sp. CY261 TaxID=2907203 RepID=UPI001F30432D|nr:lanthionine synthetase LanC family protein [Dyadobacter sp. CY261]
MLASDVEQIYQVILKGSWKVSGCGLGQGAFSSALFMSQYARMSKKVDLCTEIQELFDRGCNSVVSGRTGWLDFADLALVAHKLHEQGFIQIEQGVFFEDIDKLALAAIGQPSQIAGFENSDLGAALYAYRRFNNGAAHFSGPVREFASALACGADPAFVGINRDGNENLRTGLSAPLLFVAAAAEIGLVAKNEGVGGVGKLVDKICENMYGLSNTHFNPGFLTGDLGKAYAMLRAGMCFQRDEWITAALQILIDCAYSILDHGIGTLDMASGASGIALAFHKLYHLIGYDIFRKAASTARWLGLKAGVIIDDCYIDRGASFYHGLAGIGLSTLYWQHNRPEELDDFLWLL